MAAVVGFLIKNGEDNHVSGLVSLLRSRKFWLSVAGVLAAVGLLPTEDEGRLAESIVFIIGVLVAAIGIEDLGRNGKKDREAEDK